MIKLALAVGFLAVFGFVAYAFVLLLTKNFNIVDKKKKNKDSQLNENQNDKFI